MNDGTFDGSPDNHACRLSDQTMVLLDFEPPEIEDPTIPWWELPRRLVLLHYTADFVRLGDPVTVAEEARGGRSAHLECRPSEGLVVVWKDADEDPWLGRWYEESLEPTTPAVELASTEPFQSIRTTLIQDMRLVATGGVSSIDSPEIRVAIFNNDGTITNPVPLSFPIEGPAGPSAVWGVGASESGHALLLFWQTPFSPIQGRFIADLASGGSLFGEAFELFPAPSVSGTVVIDAPFPGLFRARPLFEGVEDGGWSGRWVSLTGTWPDDDPKWRPNTILPATTFFERDDEFFFSRLLPYDNDSARARRVEVAAAGPRIAMAWVGTGATTSSEVPHVASMAAVSATDGRTWSAPLVLSDEYTSGAPDIAGDAANWIAAWVTTDEWIHEVHVAKISADGGSATTTRLEYCGDCSDYFESRPHFGASIATDGDGTWLVAWHVDDEIRLSRSTDGGDSWSDPVAIASPAGLRGLDLACDSDGDFALLWAHDEVGFFRSTDGGLTWSDPVVLAEGTFPDYPLWALFNPGEPEAILRHESDTAYGFGVRILPLGAGTWLAAFALPGTDPDSFGLDSDVLVSRSTDDGATWSTPSPLAAYSAIDQSTDDWPALAGDGDARVVATWRSFDPGEDELGLDADLFGAVSDDGGISWSAPFLVNADGADDDATDGPSGLAHAASGTWLATWQARSAGGSDEWPMVLHTASAGLRCGDGTLDPGEECDDANSADHDGCTSRCLLPACGNGAWEDGEACDDSNLSTHDDCTADCRVAVCGDGVPQIRSYEECDDGNSVETDGCLGNCRLATCGDGVVQEGVEVCDDGNHDDTDACPSTCEPARCGDYAVLAGVEECDDGNGSQNDGCLGDCTLPRCGDGFVRGGVEACDSAILDQVDFCSPLCSWAVCPDANGSGKTTAGDAILILAAAVQGARHCPRYACDVNRDEALTASDALAALRVAVGLHVAEACGRYGDGEAIVFRLEDTRTVGALQWDVSYEGGERFRDSNGAMHCESLVPGALFASSAVPGSLRVGTISLAGFAGPLDLVRCRTFPPGEALPPLTVNVTSASALNLSPLEPLPLVSAYVE